MYRRSLVQRWSWKEEEPRWMIALAVVRSTALGRELLKLMGLEPLMKQAAVPSSTGREGHWLGRRWMREERSRRVEEALRRARPLKAC